MVVPTDEELDMENVERAKRSKTRKHQVVDREALANRAVFSSNVGANRSHITEDNRDLMDFNDGPGPDVTRAYVDPARLTHERTGSAPALDMRELASFRKRGAVSLLANIDFPLIRELMNAQFSSQVISGNGDPSKSRTTGQSVAPGT